MDHPSSSTTGNINRLFAQHPPSPEELLESKKAEFNRLIEAINADTTTDTIDEKTTQELRERALSIARLARQQNKLDDACNYYCEALKYFHEFDMSRADVVIEFSEVSEQRGNKNFCCTLQ